MSHAIGIFNGNSRNAQYRREIAEYVDHEARRTYIDAHERAMDNRIRFQEIMRDLEVLDPNWEAWYDSPAIPDLIIWKDTEQVNGIIATIKARIAEVTQPSDMGTHVEIRGGDPVEREGWPYHVEGDEELPY